jgi:hypothetical protein
MQFNEEQPLPMRIPVSDPPVAGDHVDIGVWPGGWRFMRDADRERFERLSTDDQALYLSVFEGQAAALADR